MRLPRLILLLVLAAVFAGCGPDPEIEIQRQARIEAARREAAASKEAQDERHRRETWQQLAYGAVGAAVLLLLAGVLLGSTPRSPERRP
jgi:thiosulfate reductase cytochrome b subunit